LIPFMGIIPRELPIYISGHNGCNKFPIQHRTGNLI
jgi:hypothetical protein